MDRGAWRAAVHGGHKSQTQLSNWTTTTVFVSGLSREKEPGGTVFIFISSSIYCWFWIYTCTSYSFYVYSSIHLPIYTHECMKAKLYRLLSISWTSRKAGDVSSEAGSVNFSPRMGEDGSLSSSSQEEKENSSFFHIFILFRPPESYVRLEERENSSFFHLFVIFRPPESYMRLTHFGETNLLFSVYRFKY